MDCSRFIPLIIVVGFFAALLLFTPYEAYLEGGLALAIVAAAAVGSLMHPRTEVFYVRTAVRRIDADRNQSLEHDFLAVRAELVRLWLWVIPTSLAVAALVLLAAGGPAKFSFLNWLLSWQYSFLVVHLLQFPPLFILVFLSAWIEERRVLRDAAACSAAFFSINPARVGWVGRVGYQFRGERGEYYGGDCSYFGFVHPREVASIVFYNVRRWQSNKIAMGFMFHRFVVIGRGLTDLNKQTAEARAVLAETTAAS